MLRWTLALGVFIGTLAAAAYVHGITERRSVSNSVATNLFGFEYEYHPWWSTPLALLIVCGGVALAVVILARRRGLAPAS